jgi:hypothetical protein
LHHGRIYAYHTDLKNAGFMDLKFLSLLLRTRKWVLVLFVLGVLSGGAAALFYPCHHDIHCLAKRDGWLRSRLNRSVPIFYQLPESSDSKEPWYKPANDWTKREIKELVKRQVALKKKHPISCAVVANGLTLIESDYGPFIDQHDYIFRMNNAPIEGYQEDVGTKTTFNVVVNNPISQIKNFGNNTYALIWGGKESLKSVALQKFAPGVEKPERTNLRMESPKTQKVLIFSRRFDDYIQNNWFTPEERFSTEEWSSTGFRTVILALHLCNTVDLFGFGPDANGRWWHYYKKGGVIITHLPDYQDEFLDTLDKRGIVRRYRGNLHPPIPQPPPPTITNTPASTSAESVPDGT